MTVKRDKVQAALRKKGFQQTDGEHIFLVYYTVEGKKTPVRTMISRGSKHRDIGPNLVSRMARQCRLNTGDFRRLVNCPLSRSDYEKKLEELQAI